MGILTKKEIIENIKEKKVGFDPAIDQHQLQPHAVDLRLGFVFHIPKKWDMSKEGRVAVSFDYTDNKAKQDNFELIKLRSGQYFEILPKEFIIASSLEKIILKHDSLMARLDARSSFLRRGLSMSSGVIDVGYEGTLTFPIMNNTDSQIIKLYPGERICHLVFEELKSDLSQKEAQKHGVNSAKYHQATAYGLESRFDKASEINFIKKGQIDKLKSKFKIDLNK